MSHQDRDLAGRFILITGANTGIGRSTAMQLAARGAGVVLSCRSEERTRPVLDAIRSSGGEAHFVPLDLADFASVRACAEKVVAMGRRLDVLINNAGLAGHRGLTKDGFELTFGTNHLGHFLLTMLLGPGLRAARARVVTVSSQAHYSAKSLDFDALRKPTQTLTGLREYAVSKLANILFARELARRAAPSGVASYSLHPGVVASDAWRRIPWPIRTLMKLRMISNDDGAKTTIHCATSTEVGGASADYFDKCRPKAPSGLAVDDDLARRLWAKSAEWTGEDWE